MKRVLIVASILLLILSSATVILNYQGFFDKSTLFLSENGALQVNFKIVRKDQEVIDQFSSNLGVSKDWMSGISLRLDPKTLEFLKKFPQKLTLNFTPKEVDFSSHGVSLLSSSITPQSFEMASGSAKLSVKVSGEKDYNISLSKPADLLKYATSSGRR